MTLKCVLVIIFATLACRAAFPLDPGDLPKVRYQDGLGQLLVHGQPFLILGGELGNSSAGTAAQADAILPELAKMHINTVLMPVAWNQVEPVEGRFDFSVLDHWIEVARVQQMHLVILWFGSWKNGFSSYAPSWVLADTRRFPRAISAEGLPTETLSTLGAETVHCDSRAFAALMHHVREMDADQQTILMIQVENEMGYVGLGGRDRSESANREFNGAVPPELLQNLQKRRLDLSPELAEHFNPSGHTWREVFADAAGEVYMAWHYGRYVNAVADAGKKEYPLPMYLNAQLPSPLERAGEYPSGGPHPYFQDVYRAVAPAIDFYSPDIYWPDFEYWVKRYVRAGNPAFVPEARLDEAPFNALYAYGSERAFGFSAFGVDSIQPANNDPAAGPALGEVYATLDHLKDEVLKAQQENRCRSLVLHKSSPRPTQTIALGGYLFDATLSRSWPAKTLLADDGAMLVLQRDANEFYVVGSGLTVSIARDPDTDNRIAGIANIDEMSFQDGRWIVSKALNGDQTDQGRHLSLAPRSIHLYRVTLYSYDRN